MNEYVFGFGLVCFCISDFGNPTSTKEKGYPANITQVDFLILS